MTADFLEDVLARTRRRVESQKKTVDSAALKKRFQDQGPVRPLREALRKPASLQVIAELKQASPSAGLIREEADAAGRVRAYERGGAAALSILTEEHYFHGSCALLAQARSQSSLPLLRKDFIVDPYQIEESRALGADAVLLIALLLPGDALASLIARAHDAGLDALVEVHDSEQLARALRAGARLVGINHRDLRTLKVDPRTAQRLAPQVPRDRTLVVESGIHDPLELAPIRGWGAHAVLIGEALMRREDPEKAVRSFVEAGRAAGSFHG